MNKETELLLLIAARALYGVGGTAWPDNYVQQIEDRIAWVRARIEERTEEIPHDSASRGRRWS